MNNLRQHIHMAIEVADYLGLPGISLTKWDTLTSLFEIAEEESCHVHVGWQFWSEAQLTETLPSISLLEY